ncbi:MAG TPA: DUF1707 domain-containing protein [Pseudonocardia sp.]|nr:DUF1707 domain-containing protein [Pseudonocardia sp.]
MTDPVPARDLRVSDDERRHAVSLLERATGRGLLDLDEFTARVDAALAARTRGELNAVLIDLPGLVHPDRPTRSGAVARPPAPAAAAPARRPVPSGDGALISAQLGSVTRRGHWSVPAALRVSVAMGSAELDFTETEIEHDVVEIDLDVTAGSVDLRVPEAARVDRAGIEVVLGSVSERVRGRSGGAAAGGPLFVLRGSVRAGSLEVRGPRRRWLRRS